MNWKPELDDLARREAFAREMGGVDKVKRQRDHGRLTVRERIDGLLDHKSFHEVGAISGTAEYDEQGELKGLTPANCVFGRGKIDGRTVVVVGDDFTVRGGAADAVSKVFRVHQRSPFAELANRDDVVDLALPALRHRVVLTAEAEVEGHQVDDLLRQLVRSVEVPRL